MATWTGTSKSAAPTYTEPPKTGILFYILTDSLDNVLVGTDEDETLIWQDDISFTNGSRSSTSWTPQSKS